MCFFFLCIVKSNIWLHELDNNTLLFDELLKIINIELNKQKKELTKDMKLIIDNNKTIWNNICKLEYKNNKYLTKDKFRQDLIPNGLKNNINKSLLDNITINSKISINLSSIVDYNIYLGNLLLRAHKLNNYFINSVKYLLGDYITNNKCIFNSGPVKTLKRCSVKSQVDYNNNNIPTSAHVIDIIRCLVYFDNINDYFLCINDFINGITNNKGKNIKSILRLKNGFNNKSYINGIKIPNSYNDIKMNLIVSHNNESIVGEIQFILKSMYENKNANHELYEIKRLSDIFYETSKSIRLHSNNNMNDNIISNFKGNNKKELVNIIHSNDINWNNIYNEKSLLQHSILYKISHNSNDLTYFNDIYFSFTQSIDLSILDSNSNNILHLLIKNTNPNLFNNFEILKTFLDSLDKTTIKKLLLHKNNNHLTPFEVSFCSWGEITHYLLDKYYKFGYINLTNVNKSDNNKNIFHYAFNRFTRISFNTLKILEKCLDNSKLFISLIFKSKELKFGNIPVMILLEGAEDKNVKDIMFYIINKYYFELCSNNYSCLLEYKNNSNLNVKDIIDGLGRSSGMIYEEEIRLFFEKKFENLYD